MLQERHRSPCSGRSFQHFLKNPINWRKPHVLSPPLRHSELHPHPPQPLAVGGHQLDELSPGSLCIYLFWGVLLLPTQGLSKRFLFIFGTGKTTSRNWYEPELPPNQPQLGIFLLPSTSQNPNSWRIIPSSTSASISQPEPLFWN